MEDGRTSIGFENSAVYQDAGDAFEAAQRSIVATVPGSVFRYVNSGMNVLGSIIRDQIERRGLPYHQTVYGLLVDRLGMGSYQHSADMRRQPHRLRAPVSRRLRDYAKLGVLYLNDGVWNGERLLPRGLGRLRADPDAHRHQLRRVLPHQHRSAASRPAAGHRLGVRRVGSAASSSCAAIG